MNEAGSRRDKREGDVERGRKVDDGEGGGVISCLNTVVLLRVILHPFSLMPFAPHSHHYASSPLDDLHTHSNSHTWVCVCLAMCVYVIVSVRDCVCKSVHVW